LFELWNPLHCNAVVERVCFDHLSGTAVAPEILAAMAPWFAERFSGTGAVHAGGVESRVALDTAREQAAKFLNAASPEEIIFTSSGTESLNLAIKGCALANQRRGKKIILSAIEHPAITESVAFLETLGFTATKLGVSSEGKIEPASIAAAIDDQTILVCVHAGHHDLGTIQNLRAIGDIVANRGVALLVDATYAAGWMPLDAQAINASYLAVAPHRFHAPKGVGILYKQRRARLTPLIHGGAQELSWRAGTENLPGIVGVGLACQLAIKNLPARITHASTLQAELWTGLQTAIDELRLNGPLPGHDRLPNSLNFSIAGVEGEGVALSLDMKGIAITAGQACATKASKVPAVLAALGVPEKYGPGTVIVSFDFENTSEQVRRFLDILPQVISRLRALDADDSSAA
jgi:cysteine desulfurase